MKLCSRCGARLFLEHSPDGPEWVDLQGHRFTAVPLEPLGLTPSNNVSGKRKPSTQGITL